MNSNKTNNVIPSVDYKFLIFQGKDLKIIKP